MLRPAPHTTHHSVRLSLALKATLRKALQEVEQIPCWRLYGRVTSVLGLLVECAGLHGQLSVGQRCAVLARNDEPVICEVIGFRNDHTLKLTGISDQWLRVDYRTVVPHA